jgi:peptidyl-prolyl cis-trans isomerase A (cyclophilin A)
MRLFMTFVTIVVLMFVAGCDRTAVNAGSSDDRVGVILETTAGTIELEVYPQRAPLSAGSFLAFVDAGHLDGAGFYRTVSPDNDNGSPAISVIQGGRLEDDELLPSVPHETTKDTGLLHRDGVISLARAAPGTASGAAFFICIGDQPALDFGGQRNPDGQGFATFGRVVDGMDVVRDIHQRDASAPTDSAYMRGQLLTEVVEIVSARRSAP